MTGTTLFDGPRRATSFRRECGDNTGYFIRIDPYEAYKESPLVAIRGRLRELYRRLSGNQLTTDWLHPYPDLYDRGSMVEVTSHPVLEGRQHVFIVEQAVEESASEIGSGGSDE